MATRALTVDVVDSAGEPVVDVGVVVEARSATGQPAATVIAAGLVLGMPRSMQTDAAGQCVFDLVPLPSTRYWLTVAGHAAISFLMPDEDSDIGSLIED